jgi:MFS_1 like family
MPLTDPEVTFWSYLMARSVADIFPVAALPLADTLVVVLSSFHNSDVGRELSFGALGAAVLTPLMALLVHLEVSPWPETPSALPILVFALLSLLAALALSWVKLPSVWYSRRMELGERPSQRVSHPGEAGVLLFVLLLLGIFWAALETYLPW